MDFHVLKSLVKSLHPTPDEQKARLLKRANRLLEKMDEDTGTPRKAKPGGFEELARSQGKNGACPWLGLSFINGAFIQVVDKNSCALGRTCAMESPSWDLCNLNSPANRPGLKTILESGMVVINGKPFKMKEYFDYVVEGKSLSFEGTVIRSPRGLTKIVGFL